MNFLTDLFNNIDEMKKQKKAKKPASKMEAKVKLLDFEKMISDAARSRGVQPRTYLTALASANPKFAESKLVQALLGEYSLGQIGLGARDKYKNRDSKIGVTTTAKPKDAKEPHFKKDKKKMKDEDEEVIGENNVARLKAMFDFDPDKARAFIRNLAKKEKTSGLSDKEKQDFEDAQEILADLSIDESMHKMKKKKKMKEGIFEAVPNKSKAIAIDKIMRANRIDSLADLLADAIHFAEITGLSFDREVQKAKEYYDEADQMETVSDCACEGEEGCDCDNVDEALKFQGKYKEGDKIKAYDFEPMPGRPDRFIIGTVTKVDAESQSQPGALGYHVKVEKDEGSGKRMGKTMFVPYEMGMDYDDRISSA